MSQKIATVGEMVSKISSPAESRAALQEASGIVNEILAEAGNATEHMSDDDAALLREVIELVEDAIYGSMDSAHTADVKALNDAKADVDKCNADIVDRQAADGDLGQLQQHVADKQTELDRLQGVVDEKTLANATEWNTFNQHMQMISAPPACPGLPARTMPALDVYFEKSEYSIWFAAQQSAYEAARDKFAAANSALEDAIAAYNIQLAVRDTQYCDWKDELEAACAAFDVCFQTKSDAFNALVPTVTADMNQRIENLKAGDTLVQQIRFLLGESKTRDTPESDVSRYTIAFPLLGVKAGCDLSVLDSSKWVPVVECASTSSPSCPSFKRLDVIEFDGQTRIALPETARSQGNSARSMAVWLKNGRGGDANNRLGWTIFGQGVHDRGSMWVVCARNDNHGMGIWGHFRDVWLERGNDKWEQGVWHHLAVTWDGADLIMYYDGEVLGEIGPHTAWNRELSSFDTDGSVAYFGGGVQNVGGNPHMKYFKGQAAGLRVCNDAAVPQKEVQAWMNAEKNLLPQ